MAKGWAAGKVTTRALPRNWGLVYANEPVARARTAIVIPIAAFVAATYYLIYLRGRKRDGRGKGTER